MGRKNANAYVSNLFCFASCFRSFRKSGLSMLQLAKATATPESLLSQKRAPDSGRGLPLSVAC